MIHRCIRQLTVALVVAANLLGGGCAWKHRTPALCPDCGQPPRLGCKHAPDGPTGGYHCTIWRPLADPCWHLEIPVSDEELPPYSGEVSPRPAESLPPVYVPDGVPRP